MTSDPADMMSLARKNSARTPPASATDVAFTTWVAEVCALTANASPTRIEAMLIEGRLTNIHDYLDKLPKADRDQRYASDEWLIRRVQFEALWIGGRNFFYAALNLGDRGLTKFGIFLVSLAKDIDISYAVLGGDSLRYYWDVDKNCPKTDLIKQDLLSETGLVPSLVRALRRRNAPLARRVSVCHQGDWYIEAILTSCPSTAQVMSLSVDKSRRDALLQGASLRAPIEARIAFAQYVRIKSLARQNRLSVEAV